MDVHWRPYLARCGYCSLSYTAIARLESLDEDLYYIGMLAGVSFSSVELHSGSQSTPALTREFFKQLGMRTALQLFEFYKFDFEMFDYYPEYYINLTKREN